MDRGLAGQRVGLAVFTSTGTKVGGMDVDILDVGRQIVDASLLDMRLEVIE